MPSSREEAQADLRAFEHEFYAIVDEARREYLASYASLRVNHSKRTEASILHDLMVKAARARLEGCPGFTLTLEKNLFTIAYQRKYLMKLKKLDENFHTANIPTQQALGFLNQQMCLPGMPRPTNLHLGYQRDDDSPELLACPILLACPDGEEEEVLWHWELQSGETTAAPVPLPDTAAPAAQPQRRVRVRTESDEEEEIQVEEGGA